MLIRARNEPDFHVAALIARVRRRIDVRVSADELAKESFGFGNIGNGVDDKGDVFQDFILPSLLNRDQLRQ